MSLEFSDCAIDVSARSLCRGGKPVRLEPRAFDLLLYLARHPGRLVSRETLQRHLWPDVCVSDNALARLVKEARHAVGDTGRHQFVIETRRGRGFRFVAPIRERGGSASPPYVGRAALLRQLDDLIDAACAGRGGLLLLAGEPGMGKTRTAEEFAERGRQRGARVATAWAVEGGGAPGYWPWIQVLRELARAIEPGAIRHVLGPSAHVVARLVPEVLEHAPVGPPPRIESAAERFRLFEAVRGVLRRGARDRPLLLAFDDLHWADAQSVELLDLLVHDVRGERIAILATLREPELAHEPPLADAVARLSSRPGVARQTLGGLSSDETRLFIECFTGRAPDARVAERLRDRTEGSPLFLAEVVAEGAAPPAGDAARWEEMAERGLAAVIAERVRSLSREALHVLRRAAVIGREFELGLLSRVLESPPASIADRLAEAEALRLVTIRTDLARRWRFSHALFRDALYAELDCEECTATHARIADALEAPDAASECDLDRLAHHVYLARGVIGVERAIAVAERAGRQAFEMNAFDVAVRHYGRAVRLLEEREDAQRLRLLLALGEGQRLLGRREESRESFRRAAERARQVDAPVDLARAALGFAGLYAYGPPDPEVVALLQEAADSLDAPDEALRALLLGRLASELLLDPDPARRAELRRQAWESAQMSGDLVAIVDLAAHPDHGIWDAIGTSVEPAQRLDLARSYVERCRAEGLRRYELAARVMLLDELLRHGKRAAFDREARPADRLAEEVRDPRLLWARQLQQFSLELLAGRFDAAERCGQEAQRFAQRHLDPRAAFAIWGRQLAVLRAEQGRLHELSEAWARICDAAPTVSNRALYAWICASDGDELATRRILRPLCAARGGLLAGEPMNCANAAVLAEACAWLGIADYAEPLLTLLRPYAGMNALRTYAACHGPVDYYRGLLEALRGRAGEARRCFEAGTRLAECMGAEPWAARSRERIQTAAASR